VTSDARGRFVSIAVVTACSIVSMSLGVIHDRAAFLPMYPLGILVFATRFAIGPAVAGGIAGGLAFDYLYVPPELPFTISDVGAAGSLVVMIALAAMWDRLSDRAARTRAS
jgi:K+-sensing histidine kinase KdpD